MTHDPSEYIRGLQQLLVSDKKKIAFLFGAGTSLAKKNEDSIIVPAIGKMTSDIENELCKTPNYEIAINEICQEIESKGLNYNIESLLSNIEQKIEIIGNGTLNKMEKNEFSDLCNEIKEQIRKTVSVHEQILNDGELENIIHVDFAEWIRRANRKYPIEIFTTNYDYLFELGLEEKNIPFYDGFTGSYRPFFNPESIEDMHFIPNQTKLWKLHGSLGWHLHDQTQKVWRKDSASEDILIYPSTLKYNKSKKQPYTALMDRLSNFLKQPDTILIICGYSFGDEHINERIITALNTNTSAHVLALYYDLKWNDGRKDGYLLTEDSDLSKLAKANRKLSVYGCRNAVIGGHFGEWKLKQEPDIDDTINVNLYFDEDGFSNLDDEIGQEKKGAETWTGKGELLLPDFSRFVAFLQSMIFEN
jgi:hypothetical protein